MSVFQAGDKVFLNLERTGWFQQTNCRFDNGFDKGLGLEEIRIKDYSQVCFFKNGVDGNAINGE